MKNRLCYSINLHKSLHIFRQGRGTWREILEENLDQQIEGLCHERIFQVLMYVSKASKSLHRVSYVEIQKKYGLEPNTQRLLQRSWCKFAVVPNEGRFDERPFRTEIELTQGDLVSPKIFNVVVETVIR